MKELVYMLLFVLIGITLCLLYGVNFGFGAQCTGMGYSGEDHHECVKRLVKGL